MIVDDEIFRIGSANMNNRSMGLDSECDVFVDANRPGNEHARDAIANCGIRCWRSIAAWMKRICPNCSSGMDR